MTELIYYLTGLLTLPALYGIYTLYQKFRKPSDLKAVLDRLPHETEIVTQEAIKEVCSPVNRN